MDAGLEVEVQVAVKVAVGVQIDVGMQVEVGVRMKVTSELGVEANVQSILIKTSVIKLLSRSTSISRITSNCESKCVQTRK